MDSEFRSLDERERELLEKLLEAVSTGREELSAQLNSVTAKQTIDDGTLELQCESGPPAPRYSLVAEGRCIDADGGKISVMLHVDRRGFMCLLEILKLDTTPIINPPCAREMELGFHSRRRVE